MSERCPVCRWAFQKPVEQPWRVTCRACEDLVPVKIHTDALVDWAKGQPVAPTSPER